MTTFGTFLIRFAAVFTGLAASGAALSAQTSTDVTIVITNNASPQAVRTLHFGVSPAATNGTDLTLGEDRFPPFPPSATFEARFISVGPADLLDGSPRDYRPYLSASQIDTFDLKFQAGSGGLPVRIKWNLDSVKGQYTGLKLIDAVTEGGQINVDMRSVSETSISKGSLNELYIIAEGPKKFSTVGVDAGMGAADAITLESIPNPVSESAVIRYRLPSAALVQLIVTDVYGSEVARLSGNGREDAGVHSVRFNAGSLPSGTYFYTLKADGMAKTQRMILIHH